MAFGATGPGGFVDLYYIPQADIEVTDAGSEEFDGDGFGIRGIILPAPQFAITGEYETLSYDDDAAGADFDLDQFRIGGGFMVQGTSGVLVEYINAELDTTEFDGFGIHGRLAGDVAQQLSLYAQLGWLMVEADDAGSTEDFDGLEWTLGGAFNVNKQFGAFLDYRVTNLEGDTSGVELEFSEIRVGGRLLFGS